MHDCNRESGHVGTCVRAPAGAFARAGSSAAHHAWRAARSCVDRSPLACWCASTTTRFYHDQSSTMLRVRFFKFPHWVLGQCENLISERFFRGPVATGAAAALDVFCASACRRCAPSRVASVCCEACPFAKACATRVGREAIFGHNIASLSGARSWARPEQRNRDSS